MNGNKWSNKFPDQESKEEEKGDEGESRIKHEVAEPPERR